MIGSYTRHISNPAEQDPLNIRVQSSLDGTLDELPQNNFENWQAPQVKEAIEGLQRADTKRFTINANTDEWLAQHPEFLDTNKNGNLMNAMLKNLFGDCVHTVAQFEAAYQALLVTNSLEIDQAEVVKQQQKAANERRAKARKAAAPPTEQQLYEMPLEDLRRLDAVENHKQMQKAGERGGSGW